jgi:hypothetical protein
LAVFILAAALPARAASFVEQSTFSVTEAGIAGFGRDTVGNLYVLGLLPGATNHSVTAYRTPSLEALFSFDTGARAPLAFAVEPSGVVDVLDATGATFTLKRFLNTGYFLGQSTYSLGPYISTTSVLSAAIDTVNGRLYLAYQNYRTYYCLMCLGCGCPPSGLKGYVNVYDLSGNPINVIEMPGIQTTAGSCYTPSKIAVTGQGELAVLDANCRNLLRYSSAGTLEGETPVQQATGGMAPRAMWTDAESFIFISQILCGADGCLQRVLKLSQEGNLQTTLTADSSSGCAWDERILYLSSAGQRPVRRFVLNEPPAVPAPSAPLGPVVQHSSGAWLRWQAGSDGDGDPVTFTIELGTAPFALKSTGTAETPEFVTRPLAFGTTYYWRVTARDSYRGLPLQARSSSVENFVLGLVNGPPSPFSVASGTGTRVTRDSSVLLSWSAAVDPDGDIPVYELSTRRDGETQLTVLASTATSARLSGLAFGSTYYWSVRAVDAYQAMSLLAQGEQRYLPIFRNAAPSMPVYLSTSAISTRESSYTLSWLPAEDPDEDPLNYRLFLSTDPVIGALVQEGPLTSYPLGLVYGSTFYWRVEAADGVGGVSDAGTRTFRATFLNDPPDPLKLTAPFMNAPTVKTMRDGVEVSWERVGNPQGDPITYTAYLGASPDQIVPVARIEQVAGSAAARAVALGVRPMAEAQEDGDTVRLRLSGLAYYQSYYLKVTAANPFGAASQTPLQVFSLSPSDGFPPVYNYPNPFSSSRGGTNVVFNSPPSGYSRARLTVYSEFGETLAEREYGPIPQGISQVSFDGRDRHGRPLPNGSYVGRVRFDGPSRTATFFLLVVK